MHHSFGVGVFVLSKLFSAGMYSNLLFIICCAVFYYRVGELEYNSGWFFALISVGVWLLGSYVLRFGLITNLLAQAGLFVALTLYNMLVRKRPG
jgi:hypothetical protein